MSSLIAALAALLFSFWVQPLAIFLVLLALVLGVIGLVRAYRAATGKVLGLAALVTAVLAMIVAVATSPDGQEGFREGYETPSAAPAATSPAAPPPAAPTAGSPPPAPARPRASAPHGIMSDIAWWDRTYPRIPASSCTAQGEDTVGTMHAWRVGSGGVACYDELSPVPAPPWGNKITGVDLYFSKHVSEQVALTVARSLLPFDAARGPAFPGINNEVSTKPGGTCNDVVFTSNALAAIVHNVNPTWADDPAKASAGLYSGHAAADFGSDTTYRPTSIDEVIVGIGGENRGGDGVVHC